MQLAVYIITAEYPRVCYIIPPLLDGIHGENRNLAGIIAAVIGVLCTGIAPFVKWRIGICTERAIFRLPDGPTAVTGISLAVCKRAAVCPLAIKGSDILHVIFLVMGRIAAEPRPHFLKIDEIVLFDHTVTSFLGEQFSDDLCKIWSPVISADG